MKSALSTLSRLPSTEVLEFPSHLFLSIVCVSAFAAHGTRPMWRSGDKFQESVFSSHHMGFGTSTRALRLVASAFAGKPHLILPAQVLFYSWISSRVLTSTPASASQVLQIKVCALFLIFIYLFIF